jgi:hypothetical protein
MLIVVRAASRPTSVQEPDTCSLGLVPAPWIRVETSDLEAGPDQVGRHRRAHDAEADEADDLALRHR